MRKIRNGRRNKTEEVNLRERKNAGCGIVEED